MKHAILIILVILSISSCSVDNRLWDGGKIPYKFIGYNSKHVKLFYTAKAIWEKGTNHKIEFINMTGKDTSSYNRILYVVFVSIESPVGILTETNHYAPYKNMTMYVNTLPYEGVEVDLYAHLHDLSHVLGLDMHEFQRKDRDSWLKFDYDAFSYLSLLALEQFIHKDPLFWDIEDYPVFDYSSITMYKEDVLSQILLEVPAICGGSAPSYWDFKKVKDMYSKDYQE